MLERCHACVVGGDDHRLRSLSTMAGRIGFASVAAVPDGGMPLPDPHGTPLTYFLVHHRLEEEAMHAIIGAIRGSEDDSICFAPLILIIDDCPFELVLRYIRFGYDDVISLPEKRDVLVARLSHQLDCETVYFQTDSYLGPDRRRMDRPSDMPDERRTGRAHTRLTIIRSIDKGVRVIRQELVGETPRGLARHTALLPGAGISRHP
jgi:hypothetical protein